eukprot:1750830-Prymnesium_polylepis.1
MTQTLSGMARPPADCQAPSRRGRHPLTRNPIPPTHTTAAFLGRRVWGREVAYRTQSAPLLVR